MPYIVLWKAAVSIHLGRSGTWGPRFVKSLEHQCFYATATDAGQTPAVFPEPFQYCFVRYEEHALHKSDQILRQRAVPAAARSARRTAPNSLYLLPDSREVFAAEAATMKLLLAGNCCYWRRRMMMEIYHHCELYLTASHCKHTSITISTITSTNTNFVFSQKLIIVWKKYDFFDYWIWASTKCITQKKNSM